MRGGWRATGFVKSSDRNVPFGKQDLHAKHALDAGRATNDDADPGPAGGADQA